MIELEGLSISPYSDRVKWVLDHHQISYKNTEHLLIFGMPLLRHKLRKYFGDVTVPALFDGDTRLMNSFEIAQYLDSVGKSDKLFLKDHFDEIKKTDLLSEAVCDAGRAIVTDRVSRDPAAQEALLPPFIPTALKRPLLSLAFIGTQYISRSFNLTAKKIEQHEADLNQALLEIRKILEANNFEYFLDRFSYADITVVACLQMIKPIQGSFLDQNPATRKVWTHDRFALEFADLLAWRDKIVTLHRKEKIKKLK